MAFVVTGADGLEDKVSDKSKSIRARLLSNLLLDSTPVFVLFCVILIAFVVVQFWLGDIVTVPVRIASQRIIASYSLFNSFIGGSFFNFIYYNPIWLQAIKGTNPVTAGIECLALILAEIIATVASGAAVPKTGHYAPFFIASSMVMSIGAGLCDLFTVETLQAQWVGYTFLYGFGVGLGFQQGSAAAQAVLKFKDVPIGTANQGAKNKGMFGQPAGGRHRRIGH